MPRAQPPAGARRLRQPRQDHEVSVEADALQAAHATRSKAVMGLGVGEGTLDGCTGSVEVGEPNQWGIRRFGTDVEP
jgi:hypothetical protein